MAHASGDAPMGVMAVSLLGRFSLRINGQGEVRLSDKARQLLAYLLVYQARGQPRERLAQSIWDSAADDAGELLRRALEELETALEGHVAPGLLVEQGDTWISLADGADLHVDLWAFVEGASAYDGPTPSLLDETALPSAVATERLYQGHLLEGWTEPWCREPRERAARLYALLLDTLIATYEAAEDLTKVVLYATRSLAADPGQERAHRALIHALHRLGDRTGALHQVERCLVALRAAGGREPGPETQALIDIVRAEPPGGARSASRKAL